MFVKRGRMLYLFFVFCFPAVVSIFTWVETWWFKIVLRIFLFFPSAYSFMTPLGLIFHHVVLYKCIYSALRGGTDSSCFLLTWTLNLSLYVLYELGWTLAYIFPRQFFSDEEYRTGKLSKHSSHHSAPVTPVWGGLWPQWKSNRG